MGRGRFRVSAALGLSVPEVGASSRMEVRLTIHGPFLGATPLGYTEPLHAKRSQIGLSTKDLSELKRLSLTSQRPALKLTEPSPRGCQPRPFL